MRRFWVVLGSGVVAMALAIGCARVSAEPVGSHDNGHGGAIGAEYVGTWVSGSSTLTIVKGETGYELIWPGDKEMDAGFVRDGILFFSVAVAPGLVVGSLKDKNTLVISGGEYTRK